MPYQLIYYSRSVKAGEGRELLNQLREIVSTSRYNNARAQITGFLIFDNPWFVQVLEGDRPKIEATYRKIRADKRHGDLTIVNLGDVESRSFPTWSMGCSLRSPETQELYLRRGLSGPLDPRRLKSAAILDLALGLSGMGPTGQLFD